MSRGAPITPRLAPTIGQRAQRLLGISDAYAKQAMNCPITVRFIAFIPPGNERIRGTHLVLCHTSIFG